MRKIEILDKASQQAFDSPPVFTQADQKKYFTLPDDIAQCSNIHSTELYQQTMLQREPRL